MKITNLFDTASSRINKVLEILCVIFLIIMCLIVWYQVFLRYVLSMGVPWAEEVAKYIMVWMALLGAALVLYEGTHVSIQFITNRIGITRRTQIFHLIMSMVFFILLVYYGWDYATDVGLRLTSPTIGITRFWPYLAIPVGAAFMIFHSITLILKWFSGEKVIKGDELDELEQKVQETSDTGVPLQ